LFRVSGHMLQKEVYSAFRAVARFAAKNVRSAISVQPEGLGLGD